MCKYCEIDILSNEAKRNIRKNQRVTIKIVRNMLNENLYYLEVDTNSYQKEEIPISYCPMCRKEVGRVRVMISQPMANRTEEDVRQERKAIIEKFNNMHIEVIDTIFTDEVPIDYNAGVYYLGKSIKEMSKVDALFMCNGWREARGCRIERQVAQEYGIKILYNDFFVNEPKLSTRTMYYKEDKQ